jgi:transglutaminase superfamily protein
MLGYLTPGATGIEMENLLEYYAHHGAMTAAGPYGAELQSLPREIGALCEVIQGVLIHRDIAPFLYQTTLSEEKRDEAHSRAVSAMLARIHSLDAKPLTSPRERTDRMAGVCRHFSILLTAILREQGVAARARCGFGAYFTTGKFEDHWVCEYWNAAQERWIMVDAQLDAIQREALRIDFDPLDVPRDRFIVASDAWQMCRSGRAEPERFGLSYVHLQGLWFVAGNVLRDFASLNRMEMLPWDVWGLMTMDDAALTDQNKALLDRIAALSLVGDDAFAEIRAIYESEEHLRVPQMVFNALRNASEPITV